MTIKFVVGAAFRGRPAWHLLTEATEERPYK